MSEGDVQLQNQNHDNQHQPTQNTSAVMTDVDLQDMLRYLEAWTQHVIKNAYQLLNIYFVFLGALLTAVAQLSSSSGCHLRFYFIALSVVPFFLNGVPLYVQVKKENDRCALERERRRDQRNGGGQSDAYREMMYRFGLIFVIFLLVVFNGVVVFACNSILCGDHNKHVSGHAACVKVRNYTCATDKLD